MPVYCDIILNFPTHTSPTATFQPAHGAILTSTKFKFRGNAIVHEMFDPRIMYTYIKGGTFQEKSYEIVFDSSQFAAFYSFWGAALGNSFEMQDPFNAPGWGLYRFAPTSVEPELDIISGTQGEFWFKSALTMRDAIS